MIIEDREAIIRGEMDEAFQKLFEGLYGEIGAIMLYLQKAIHHWDNVSASYERLAECASSLGSSPPEAVSIEDDYALTGLTELDEINKSLDALYRQIRSDRIQCSSLS